MAGTAHRTLGLMACVIPLAACGASKPPSGTSDAGPSGGIDAGPDEDSDAGTFVAKQGAFADFLTWTHFSVDGPAEADPHIDGHRDLYIKALPPHGSTEFPQGTIIVKVLSNAQTFAMVKRGHPYNELGAKGWEWFELQQNSLTEPLILWRGVKEPAGDIYGTFPTTATCNSCHSGAAANDYVQDPQLKLSKF